MDRAASSALSIRLRGSWLLRESGDEVEAWDLKSGDRIALSPSLLEPPKSASLALLGGVAMRLLRALDEPPRAVSLASVLAPCGWDTLFVELTGRCNERCTHCYADAGPEVDATLELDLVRRVLEEARALGFRRVQLTGGDPLIAPIFLEAARVVVSLGMGLEVYTNGLALRRPLAKELVRLGARLAFSFYSANEAHHDAITRTPGSQRRTLEAIALGLELGLPLRVSIIVGHENFDDLDETCALLRALGVPSEAVYVAGERSVGRGKEVEQDPSRISTTGVHAERDRFGGQLALGYDGLLYPCIFDRRTPIGDLRISKLPELVAQELEFSSRSESKGTAVSRELSCSDCQMRRAILSEARWRTAGASRLVPLERRKASE